MSNPANVGEFDIWISAQIVGEVLTPASGDTGSFDIWLSSTIPPSVYQQVEASLPPLSVSVDPADDGYNILPNIVIGG